MYDGICEAIHRELDVLDEKYAKGTQMSNSDLEAIDKMAHALKSIAGYEAMRGARVRYSGRYAVREESPYDRRY